MEHMLHARDLARDPAAQVFIECAIRRAVHASHVVPRGVVATEQIRHIRHPPRVPRANVAVRCLGGDRVAAPRGHRRAQARRVGDGGHEPPLSDDDGTGTVSVVAVQRHGPAHACLRKNK